MAAARGKVLFCSFQISGLAAQVAPTGHVGAMAYYTADAIMNKYVANPGPLV